MTEPNQPAASSQEEPSRRGGVREGAGRKRVHDTDLLRTTVTLTPKTANLLQELGHGNTSQAIRELAERYQPAFEAAQTAVQAIANLHRPSFEAAVQGIAEQLPQFDHAQTATQAIQAMADLHQPAFEAAVRGFAEQQRALQMAQLPQFDHARIAAQAIASLHSSTFETTAQAIAELHRPAFEAAQTAARTIADDAARLTPGVDLGAIGVYRPPTSSPTADQHAQNTEVADLRADLAVVSRQLAAALEEMRALRSTLALRENQHPLREDRDC